jgi:hypothetical protein
MAKEVIYSLDRRLVKLIKKVAENRVSRTAGLRVIEEYWQFSKGASIFFHGIY